MRNARARVTGWLRGRGWASWLMMLWVGLGATGSGYIFVVSTRVSEPPTFTHLPSWVGEPDVIIAAGYLGAAAWFVLTIPVLAAGLVRLRTWRTGRWLRAAAWAGAWLAGIVLMIKVASWQTSAPEIFTCVKVYGCALSGFRGAVVSWIELPIFVAWLPLGVVMTLILGRPAPHNRQQLIHQGS
jgi:hypothetical protein